MTETAAIPVSHTRSAATNFVACIMLGRLQPSRLGATRERKVVYLAAIAYSPRPGEHSQATVDCIARVVASAANALHQPIGGTAGAASHPIDNVRSIDGYRRKAGLASVTPSGEQ